ncbi:uncharacterized protein LOC129579060 [Sitodiplosis mosellana]|uniref:uncharacterized protein LOC129579060 n=1 Tax=Sitodiplosis mosellana TaxID=263140 RepID=UPI002443A75C|nr:uncharacterized protein LOC129579060 [Sitodiplosis mosellana]
MSHHRSYCIVLIVLSVIIFEIIEAIPQFDFGRSILNPGGFAQQNTYRQESIDEFLALRPSNLNQNGKPCVPQQFYPRRAKPPYNSYGGYFCGNQNPQRPIQQPGHKNNPFWSHFSNVFGGVFGPNTNVVAAPTAAGNGVKPIREDNDHDNNPNEIDRWKPGTPVGGIQNVVNGLHQDLSGNRFPRLF